MGIFNQIVILFSIPEGVFADCFYFFVCVCKFFECFDGKLLYSAKNKPKYQLFLFFIKKSLDEQDQEFFCGQIYYFFLKICQ
ncbi:hypothetical protein BSK20_04735 [SR1 bacterium human oral taxon HOT-345]|nr:hypothetical protein BSK20_04735 [SR1 bacterium human oral taxon HOT-345]